MIKKKTIKKIFKEVEKKLPEIFEENLIFGFVCGGFANGYGDNSHDVDIFVCVKENITPEIEKKYLKWYFGMHLYYGLKPDVDYPGEIMTYKKLRETLSVLNKLVLSLTITEIKIKKAIIWADMITSNTVAEVGPGLYKLYKLKNEFRSYPKRWKKEVLSLIPVNEKARWKNKSHLLIMERFMKYPKYDGRGLKVRDYL